ncbi:MAG: TauD/TfdA family dioxygenase [Hyphomicrobiales bacterium]|nr:TauD/TfdA family dioxygenase [Hyphomicrobiales bacterium]
MSNSRSLEVTPLHGAHFGAEIIGLDPGDISASDKETIWQAYRQRHGLICFTFDRLLEADELHALTAVFGDNEFAPGIINGIGKATPEGEENVTVEEQVAALRAGGRDPYMAYIGNLDPSTLKAEPVDQKFFGEWEWHTDMSYIPVPPTFSLLHARVVPEDGGDTGLCSQVMAARELPPDLRRRVTGKRIKHDSTYGSSGIPRPGMTAPASPVEAVGHPHPIIRKVPTTGEEALFLGRRTNGYVVGMDLADSEALLDELWAHATQEHFCYRHNWKVGQVVAWDNRMMLHMRYPFDNAKARLMWRTQTKGEAVVPAHA